MQTKNKNLANLRVNTRNSMTKAPVNEIIHIQQSEYSSKQIFSGKATFTHPGKQRPQGMQAINSVQSTARMTKSGQRQVLKRETLNSLMNEHNKQKMAQLHARHSSQGSFGATDKAFRDGSTCAPGFRGSTAATGLRNSTAPFTGIRSMGIPDRSQTAATNIRAVSRNDASESRFGRYSRANNKPRVLNSRQSEPISKTMKSNFVQNPTGLANSDEEDEEEEEEPAPELIDDSPLYEALSWHPDQREQEQIDLITEFLSKIAQFQRFPRQLLEQLQNGVTLQVLDFTEKIVPKKPSENKYEDEDEPKKTKKKKDIELNNVIQCQTDMMYMVLVGDIFWLGYDPSLSITELKSGKCPDPKPVQNDKLLDINSTFGQHQDYCSFLFASSPSQIAVFDKSYLKQALNADFLEVKDYPLFRDLSRDEFSKIYTSMEPLVFERQDTGTKPVMHIGDPADCMFVVRQGKVDELHQIPCVSDERVLSFCRHYRTGQWFGLAEIMPPNVQHERISRVQISACPDPPFYKRVNQARFAGRLRMNKQRSKFGRDSNKDLVLSPTATERECDSPSQSQSTKQGGPAKSTISQSQFNPQKETVFSEVESNYDSPTIRAAQAMADPTEQVQTTVLLKIPKDVVTDVILRHYGVDVPPLAPKKLAALKRDKRIGMNTHIKRINHKQFMDQKHLRAYLLNPDEVLVNTENGTQMWMPQREAFPCDKPCTVERAYKRVIVQLDDIVEKDSSPVSPGKRSTITECFSP